MEIELDENGAEDYKREDAERRLRRYSGMKRFPICTCGRIIGGENFGTESEPQCETCNERETDGI